MVLERCPELFGNRAAPLTGNQIDSPVVDCLEVLQVRERDIDRLRVEPVVLAALRGTGALT